jgi:hypothetical protein
MSLLVSLLNICTEVVLFFNTLFIINLNLFIIINILWYLELNNYSLQLTCKAPGNVQNWHKKAGQITVQERN